MTTNLRIVCEKLSDREDMIKFLSDNGEVDQQDLNESLIYCVEECKYDLAKLLISKGADLQELMIFFVEEEQYHCDQIAEILEKLGVQMTFKAKWCKKLADFDEFSWRGVSDITVPDNRPKEPGGWYHTCIISLTKTYNMKWFKHINNKWDGKSPRIILEEC